MHLPHSLFCSHRPAMRGIDDANEDTISGSNRKMRWWIRLPRRSRHASKVFLFMFAYFVLYITGFQASQQSSVSPCLSRLRYDRSTVDSQARHIRRRYADEAQAQNEKQKDCTGNERCKPGRERQINKNIYRCGWKAQIFFGTHVLFFSRGGSILLFTLRACFVFNVPRRASGLLVFLASDDPFRFCPVLAYVSQTPVSCLLSRGLGIA